MITVEINDTENRKSLNKCNKPKQIFGKIKQTDKPSATLTKK